MTFGRSDEQWQAMTPAQLVALARAERRLHADPATTADAGPGGGPDVLGMLA